jgi:hypothetical protein
LARFEHEFERLGSVIFLVDVLILEEIWFGVFYGFESVDFVDVLILEEIWLGVFYGFKESIL